MQLFILLLLLAARVYIAHGYNNNMKHGQVYSMHGLGCPEELHTGRIRDQMYTCE